MNPPYVRWPDIIGSRCLGLVQRHPIGTRVMHAREFILEVHVAMSLENGIARTVARVNADKHR